MADERRVDHLYSINRPPDPRRHIITVQREQRDRSPVNVIRRSPVPGGIKTRTPPPAHSRVSPAPQVVYKRSSPAPPAAHHRESPVHLSGKPLTLAQAQALLPGAVRPVYLPAAQADLRSSPQLLLARPSLPLPLSYTRSPSPVREQVGPQNLSRPSSRESPIGVHRLSPSQQAILSGGGLLQVPKNRISPVPSHVYPAARPASRDEARPSSRDSWHHSPRQQSSSRPSSRDSAHSGGPVRDARPSSRDSTHSSGSGRPASRESPLHHGETRSVSPASRDGAVPRRQLHQLLTQSHPAQSRPIQILTAQGIQVVQSGQPLQNPPPGLPTNKLDSAQRYIPLTDHRYLSPGQVVRSLSPEQQRRESAPHILHREPSPHQQQLHALRRESAPNLPPMLPRPVIKVEEPSPPSTKKEPRDTNPGGKSNTSIPNAFFSGLKLPGSQHPVKDSGHVARARPTPTSAEVAASQALTELMEVNNQQILRPHHHVKPVAPHSAETLPSMSLPEGAVAPILQDVPPSKKKNIKKEPPDQTEQLVKLTNPFNMRVMTLANFPVTQTSYRSNYRSHTVAIHRAKAGSITSTARSLDLLRQNLQKHIDKEINAVIQKYIDQFFKPGIENMKSNNGETAVTEEHIQGVCRQILEEAKKMYGNEIPSPRQEVPDNVSEGGTLAENKEIREKKKELFIGRIRRRRGSSDSEASSHAPRKKKKGRPAIHAVSGRSTPLKTGRGNEPVKREGPKWDPDRLKTETQFVMGSRANKALGLGATRGRIYIKHPDIFKYSGDQDDKQWLHENHLMSASGGKAYLLIVEDIKDLAETDEYKNHPALMLHELHGFTVPEWMLEKMKVLMQSMRTDAGKAVKPHKSKDIQRLQDNNVADDDDRSSTYQDEDEEVRLPFQTMAQRGGKSMPQSSPANTDNLDGLSSDNDDAAPISPFNTARPFSNASPAPDMSPAASEPEDDAALPF